MKDVTLTLQKNKIFTSIANIFIILWEVTMIMISIVTAKDPCKKCLVTACCIDKCEERILLENFILKGDTLKERKLMAWFFIIYVPGIIIFSIFQLVTR